MTKVVKDMTDAGLFDVYGDILHEIPELFDALRMQHYKERSRQEMGGSAVRVSGVPTRLECRSASVFE